MKKNGTHRELIIESLFPAVQVPEKEFSGLVHVLSAAMPCHTGPASELPIAFTLIEIRWFSRVEPGLGVTWKHLFYGEDV